MRMCAAIAGFLLLGTTAQAQCEFQKTISCLCEVKWVDRPYTTGCNYFTTEQVWNQVSRTCWSDFVQFVCTESPPRKRKARTSITGPLLNQALTRAKRESKLVFFIGMTGG